MTENPLGSKMRPCYFPWINGRYIIGGGANREIEWHVFFRPYRLFPWIYWWLWSRTGGFFGLMSNVVDNIGLEQMVGAEITGFLNDAASWMLDVGVGDKAKSKKVIVESREWGLIFIKYSDWVLSFDGISKEVEALKSPALKNMVPELLCVKRDRESIYFITRYILHREKGRLDIDEGILRCLYELHDVPSYSDAGEKRLMEVASHGDFTPWNVLLAADEIKVVDWEHSGFRVLGYDLFTYILHPRVVMGTNVNLIDVIRGHYRYIVTFFRHYEVVQWEPYLSEYLRVRSLENLVGSTKRKYLLMADLWSKYWVGYSEGGGDNLNG